MKRRDFILIITLLSLFAFIVVLLETGKIVGIENFVYKNISLYINPIFTIIVKIITNIGGPVIIAIICLVLCTLHQTRMKYGIPVFITVVISFILNTILKYIFARQRPSVLRLINETSYSFPSGHSMINAALYTIIILLLLKNADKKGKRIIVSISLVILFVIIGLSRVYLGVHYFGDVLAGWILGVFVAFIVYLVIKYFETKNILDFKK